MSDTHQHQWLADRSRSRFTCTTCGTVGHAPKIIPGQLRTARYGITPYRCAHRFADGHYCGVDVTSINGVKGSGRCAEHQGKAVGDV